MHSKRFRTCCLFGSPFLLTLLLCILPFCTVLCFLVGVLWYADRKSLGWVTHVSESGHRLLLPMFEGTRTSELRYYTCGYRVLVFDFMRRQVQTGPMFEIDTQEEAVCACCQPAMQHLSDDAKSKLQLTVTTVSRNGSTTLARQY